MFQSINYFLFQIEEFNLSQWLTNINVLFKKNDKYVVIQSRYFNTLKINTTFCIFPFINIFCNSEICAFLDDTNQEKMFELATK